MNREKIDLSRLRENYQRGTLDIEDLERSPYGQFDLWLKDAIADNLLEPNAFILSTVGSDKRPSSRTVLIKEVVCDSGFVFFTNYESKKAQELAVFPYASALILWKEQERQIRIEGIVEKIDQHSSEEYFQSRPLGSQLGAWASPQSQEVPSREILEDRLELYRAAFANKEHIPKPPHWGGYILKPDYFEFWQGRRNRLHDRLVYSRTEGEWVIKRLAP